VTEESAQRLVLVLGVGRSGTSLIAGILGKLGFHIPQPEIQADDSNPRGFGEPEWVVDFHKGLMRRLRVTVFDARPAAWQITGEAARDPEPRAQLHEWLAAEATGSDSIVVKDPRIAWFLPLWLDCAREVGLPVASITMLRHPAQILTSARTWYGTWQTDASRAASWVNVMLETERATRSTPRAFLRYEDLLADWRGQVGRTGRELSLPTLSELPSDRVEQIDELVDPGLHRAQVGWGEVAVPESVRDLADTSWEALQLLAADGRGADGLTERFDALRGDYVGLYEEAEAIAQSSVTAVKPRRRQPAKKNDADHGWPAVRRAIARRLPERYRKRLRGIARRL
jgi:hypothetical protein